MSSDARSGHPGLRSSLVVSAPFRPALASRNHTHGAHRLPACDPLRRPGARRRSRRAHGGGRGRRRAAPPALVPLLVGEAVVGLGLGLAAALAFAAAAWAGGILGAVSGMDGSAEIAPDAPAGEGGAARLAAWLGMAGFLLAGGHLAIVAGLVDSVSRLPVGTLAATGGHGLADLVATLPTAALNLSLSLAAPALAAVLAFQLAAAVSLRAVRCTAGPGLVQAAVSLVLLAAVC
ncbi:MAG: hypothetical protein EBX36_09015, partial [Planctomycetia bacterium]|nr:hypothetical protein [Planctomycetia bacterium]